MKLFHLYPIFYRKLVTVMINKYMSNNGTELVFNGYYLEIYIPELYFETKLAENQGGTIHTFGLLNATVFDNKMKSLHTEIINLPTMIYLYPSEIETKTMSFNNNPEPKKYKVAKFYKGDNVMPSMIQQDGSNAELFLNLMCAGKIDFVPYDQILNVWERNLELNGTRLNVPSAILGIIISEIYRNKNNPNEKFSKVAGTNPKISQYDYRTANMREICSRNSTFAALTFEDMDSMITTSLNMKNYNKKQVESPIEKIIKM